MYNFKTSTASSDTGHTEGHSFRLKIDTFSTTSTSLGVVRLLENFFIFFLREISRSDSIMSALSTRIRESHNAQNSFYIINVEYDQVMKQLLWTHYRRDE